MTVSMVCRHLAVLGVTALLALAALPAVAAEKHDAIFWSVRADEFEWRVSDGPDFGVWDIEGWVGTDEDKIALSTEGERLSGGPTEKAEVQLYYKRLISDFFDLEVGARHDVYPKPSRSYGVIGVEGLAPQWFEVDAHAFLSVEGDVSARLSAEYDVLITQRLILQPTAEVNLALTSDREIGSGSGVNDVELGLRLRYEFTRKFAPYLGVAWERKLGETADFARDENEDIDSLALVAGIRFWF